MVDTHGDFHPPGQSTSQDGTGRFRASYRILVVDDNRDAAESMRVLLKLMGAEVRAAFDGLEALEVAASFRPQAILLDIGMPKLHGYDVARRLRQEKGGREIVLVALTGWGREEDRRRAEEAGFDGHLIKPVQASALRELLESLMERTPPQV